MKEAINHNIFKIISQAADNLNIQAYVVGGYVRDYILNRPSPDIDITVVGSGVLLAKEVAKLSGNKHEVKVFKNFGTAMLHVDGLEIEFVGARKESYRSESRKPLVENGSLEDDISRRDFTINSLAISLKSDNSGELIDMFDGLNDIKERLIRTPLEAGITFSDDPLRMIRAIRFATQLEFYIEPNTFNAIKENKSRISIVSSERITEELNKIILSSRPSTGFLLLDDSGLLEIIFPQFYALKGVDIIGNNAHKDNFYHTLEVLDKLSLKTNNLWLRWAAILHDIGKPITKKYEHKTGWTFHAHDYIGAKMAAEIFRDFRLPLNEKMKYVQKLVQLHLRPIALVESKVTDSAVRRLLFDAGDDIDDLMILCEADITSKIPHKVSKYLVNYELVRSKLKEIEEKDKLRNWQPPIDGEEIMKIFGIQPCFEVGIIKNSIRDAILCGKISNNYQEAFNFMLEEGIKMGLKPNI